MTAPVTGITPVYGIEFLIEGEPVGHTRQKLQRNAEKIEAAMLARGLPPSDLAALIAAGWFSDSGWVSLTPPAGFTTDGSALAVRKLGKAVQLRGRVKRTAGAFPTTAETFLNLPTGFRVSTGTARFLVPGFSAATANGIIVNATSSSDALTGAGFGGSSDTVWLDGINWVLT